MFGTSRKRQIICFPAFDVEIADLGIGVRIVQVKPETLEKRHLKLSGQLDAADRAVTAVNRLIESISAIGRFSGNDEI